MRLERAGLGRYTAIVVATAAICGVIASPAMAQSGGTTDPAAPTTGTPGVATLQADGSAIAPPDAPPQVRKAINAANRIRTKPYIYGGGHRSFKAKGYDCSGAVSYVLHAAGLLKRPMPSGSFIKGWGAPGTGQWITTYANRGHMYVMIAGLRWDTSVGGDPVSTGRGPRWRSTPGSTTGYSSRYAPGL